MISNFQPTRTGAFPSQKCDTMVWKFRCYVSHTGRCDVNDTYANGTAELKANFDTAVEYLQPLGREKWAHPRNYAARLDKQKWPDFFELRFKANKIQQRPIGFFGPGADEFTIVMWCIEKTSIQPESWFKTANERRKSIIDGTATTTDLIQG